LKALSCPIKVYFHQLLVGLKSTIGQVLDPSALGREVKTFFWVLLRISLFSLVNLHFVLVSDQSNISDLSLSLEKVFMTLDLGL
jgi:hypothetical protein